MGFLIRKILSQSFILVTHSVTLYICFGSYVNSVLITEFVPTGIVRIMAGSDSVDIMFLHYFNVLDHTFHRYHISSVGIHFVAIGSLYENGLTVYEEL